MSSAINDALGRLHNEAFTASQMIFRESAEAAAQFMQEVG